MVALPPVPAGFPFHKIFQRDNPFLKNMHLAREALAPRHGMFVVLD
jgi:hypothetical protein